MSKLSIRRRKITEIPRPENARPLIVATILTIIALACGALALAGRTRPAEERQTPAYVPPTRPPYQHRRPRGMESLLVSRSTIRPPSHRTVRRAARS